MPVKYIIDYLSIDNKKKFQTYRIDILIVLKYNIHHF